MNCCLNPDRVGRDGTLGLTFQRRGQRSILLQSRFTLPLQVLAPLYLEDGTAYLMLLNPTGGVLGGDRLTSKIVLGENTHVCLTTPSATRIYRTHNDAAVQETAIQVGAGATLEYFPDHAIPQAGSAFRQSLRVEIAAGGRALQWDAMASGRLGHGESWKFKEFESRMEIFLRGKPVYLNRTRIEPAQLSPERLGIMESFHYSGSLAIVADEFELWPQLAAEMNRQLQSMSAVCGGVTLLANHGCLVRLLANSAADLTEASIRLWEAARPLVVMLPPLQQRKY